MPLTWPVTWPMAECCCDACSRNRHALHMVAKHDASSDTAAGASISATATPARNACAARLIFEDLQSGTFWQSDTHKIRLLYVKKSSLPVVRALHHTASGDTAIMLFLGQRFASESACEAQAPVFSANIAKQSHSLSEEHLVEGKSKDAVNRKHSCHERMPCAETASDATICSIAAPTCSPPSTGTSLLLSLCCDRRLPCQRAREARARQPYRGAPGVGESTQKR